jgi:hypothetical protein
MVKAIKFLRKQAEKAKGVAQKVQDREASREMLILASAYRAQADILKQKKKTKKVCQLRRPQREDYPCKA